MTTPTSTAKMASEFIGTFFLTMTIFIAAVLGGDVQRSLLPRRHVNADRSCGGNGLHGAGPESLDVAPV